MKTHRTLTVLFAAVAVSMLGVAPATAAPRDAFAMGWAGSVDAWSDDEPIIVDPVAPCETDGPPQGSSGTVAITGYVSFAGGDSECTIDDAGEIASVDVTGGRFRLDALLEHNGPRIRMSSYSASCYTTLNGARSWVELSGVSGMDVPDELPSNYEVTIPSRIQGEPPLATVTLNEIVTPNPPDGSMTVNVMHIRMFPEGPGPDGGDVIVGSVHCAPID